MNTETKVAHEMLTERKIELSKAIKVTNKAKETVEAIKLKLKLAEEALHNAQKIQSEKQRKVWVQEEYMEKNDIK